MIIGMTLLSGDPCFKTWVILSVRCKMSQWILKRCAKWLKLINKYVISCACRAQASSRLLGKNVLQQKPCDWFDWCQIYVVACSLHGRWWLVCKHYLLGSSSDTVKRVAQTGNGNACLQNKSCTFGNIVVAVIRHNFYCEGEHTPDHR